MINMTISGLIHPTGWSDEYENTFVTGNVYLNAGKVDPTSMSWMMIFCDGYNVRDK